MGLVHDLNSRMAQMPPLFNDNQLLDESEVVDYLANKAPRSHKEIMISQDFIPETGDLATFVKHCERAETIDNIAMAKSSTSNEDSDTIKNKKCYKKTKEREDSGKKRRKNSSLYCSLHWENNCHTSRECTFLKARDSEKDKSKYRNKDYKKSFNELNILQAETAHQKS